MEVPLDHVPDVMRGWIVLKDEPTPTFNMHPAHHLALQGTTLCGFLPGKDVGAFQET